jgi:hypothetical protein
MPFPFHGPRLPTLAALMGAALLSACATPTALEDPATKKPRQYLTGSRLPAGTSSQIVRTVEGGSAHESLRSQPNPGRPGF